MQIWVDADACPVVIKEILFRAAEKRRVKVTLVANRLLKVPPSPWIRALQVASGFDVADDWIVGQVAAGDLVVTADLPLAAAVLERGSAALNPRGELYSLDSIRAKVTMRDFMETLRASGIQSGGPPPLHQRDRQAFANALDRLLTQRQQGG